MFTMQLSFFKLFSKSKISCPISRISFIASIIPAVALNAGVSTWGLAKRAATNPILFVVVPIDQIFSHKWAVCSRCRVRHCNVFIIIRNSNGNKHVGHIVKRSQNTSLSFGLTRLYVQTTPNTFLSALTFFPLRLVFLHHVPLFRPQPRQTFGKRIWKYSSRKLVTVGRCRLQVRRRESACGCYLAGNIQLLNKSSTRRVSLS